MKSHFNTTLNRKIVTFNYNTRQFSVPRLLHQRYEIYDILAAGGMGVIFNAKDTKLFNKKVLIKRCLYNPSLFQYANDKNRENGIANTRRSMDIEYAAMLHGWARKIPNIPIPIDRFEDINPEIFGPHKDNNGKPFTIEKKIYEKEPYIVMNYFTGKPVKSDNPEVSQNVIGFVIFYIITIANILERFHIPFESNGNKFEFFYCDLKPDNVMQTDDKRLVLIDMGSFAIRVNGNLAGDITTTPGYCAPELKNNQAMYLSSCVDVYTLAVTAFELITEQPPKLDQYGKLILDWKKFKEVINAAKRMDLEPIFKQALDMDPQKRFKTMRSFINAINNKKTGKIFQSESKYFTKTLKKPVKITYDWETKSGAIDYAEKTQGNIINFPVWKKEKFFDIQKSASQINQTTILNSMKQSLLDDLFDKSKNNIIKNLTFCPELMEITSQNIYLNYLPGLKFMNPKTIKWQLNRNLVQILYLFLRLETEQYRILGVSPETISFDTLGNPFMSEFWLMLSPDTYHFAENPLIQNVVGKNIILPPETKHDRIWKKDKSFSYLAGITILFEIIPKEILKLYHQDNLYEKIHYERIVRSLGITPKLKEVILNLINPIANIRLTPYEAVSKLKNRPQNKVSRILKNKGVQIQCTNNLMKYKIQFREISNVTNKVLNWKYLEKHIILSREPNDNFKNILKQGKTKWHTFDKKQKQSLKNEIVMLLNSKIQNKQTDLAVLLIDNSVNQIKNELNDILKKFKKVIIFAKQNPFESLTNVKYYPIDNFMIKKTKAKA